MNNDTLIESLSAELVAVRPLSLTRSRVLVAAAAALTLVLLLGALGLRPDLASSQPQSLPLVLAALFAMTAVAAGWGAIRISQPAVGGANQSGPLWLLGALLVLAGMGAWQAGFGHGGGADIGLGLRCLAWGLAASMMTAAALVVSLHAGATVLPDRAGLLAGIAAGSVGALAITFECDGNDLVHLGIFHVAVVALWALVGRFGLSRLVRW